MVKVSVCMPVYNTKPEYLREAVESVLNQTFKDFEFLILNDSPDNIELDKIISSYDDKRIKYSKNAKNIGISESRNKLLKTAKGEYVAVFDHDDISLPNRLEKEVEYLDKNPDISVVGSWAEYFGAKNYILKTPENDNIIKMCLTDNSCMSHTSVMIRKSVLIENNIKYESFYSPVEDYCLWVRLMDKIIFHNIQQVLVRYRCHDKNTSVVRHQEQIKKHSMVRFIACDNHPFLRQQFEKYDFYKETKFRIRLFGFIPILKLKNNKLYLFEFIPIFKVKWNSFYKNF